jgi:hypothetical protein
LATARDGHHEAMRGTAPAIACALVLAGCGEASPQLAPIERRELHAFVERARTAARAQDLAATNAALVTLRARVRTLRARGRIDRAMADRLLKYSAVTQLRARQTLAPAGAAEDG